MEKSLSNSALLAHANELPDHELTLHKISTACVCTTLAAAVCSKSHSSLQQEMGCMYKLACAYLSHEPQTPAHAQVRVFFTRTFPAK